MGYLPIFLELAAARCLVVGGGEVAQRKAQALLDAGADLTVVSPTVSSELENHVHGGRIRLVRRTYVVGDMKGHALVFAATGDAILHRALFEEARALSIPINVADQPELCTFIMPAVMRRGALTFAVSTGGASPAMAKRLAARLTRIFGPEYGLALEILGAARVRLKASESSAKRRSCALTALAASRLPALLRRGDLDGVDRVLIRHTGVGLEELSVAGLRQESEETLPAR